MTLIKIIKLEYIKRLNRKVKKPFTIDKLNMVLNSLKRETYDHISNKYNISKNRISEIKKLFQIEKTVNISKKHRFRLERMEINSHSRWYKKEVLKGNKTAVFIDGTQSTKSYYIGLTFYNFVEYQDGSFKREITRRIAVETPRRYFPKSWNVHQYETLYLYSVLNYFSEALSGKLCVIDGILQNLKKDHKNALLDMYYFCVKINSMGTLKLEQSNRPIKNRKSEHEVERYSLVKSSGLIKPL